MSNSELNQLRQKYAIGGAVAKKFVSSIDNAIQTLKQQKGTGEQMLKQIQSSGVKKEEMDLRRVPQFLANKPSVTKEQLARHLEKNPIPQINVIEKVSKFGGKTRQWQDPDGAWNNNHAKFGDATLQTPGGKNYREHLLQLQMPALSKEDIFKNVSNKYKPEIEELTRAYRLRIDNGEDASAFSDRIDHLIKKRNSEAEAEASLSRDNEYSNGHWDEPQVVAHVRMTDRAGPEGEKILHVEEMQSDWHQQGREARKGQAKILAREKGISVADALKEIPADAGYLTPKDDAALAKLNKDIYRVGREGVNEEEIKNHFVPGRVIRSNLLDQDLVNNYHDKVLAFDPKGGRGLDISKWTVETAREFPHSGQRELRVLDEDGQWRGTYSGFSGTDADAIKQAAARSSPVSWSARVIEVDPKTGESVPGALPRDISNQSNIDRTDPTLNTLRSYREQRDALSRKVPDAPFKSTWPDLVVKHVFDTAAREGYDKVSFAPAAEHIKRYNMANYVDEITATLRPNGKFDIQGIKDKTPILDSKGISREDLAAHVGKDQAEKIVSQIDNRPKQDPSWDEIDPPMVSLAGENLKMGTKQAAGMVKFYDEMLPKLVDKYSSKEFGVGAGRTFIPELDTGKNPSLTPMGWAESRRVGNAFSVDIPQSTKDKILSQGQKLFSVAPAAPVGLGLSQEEPAKYAKGGIAKKLAERAAKSIESKVNRAKTEWEILHDTAQKNAALPKDKGGLGLPADNTYIDRANAMGKKDVYHGTKQDITGAFKPGYDDNLAFVTESPEFASKWIGKGKLQQRSGGQAEQEVKSAEDVYRGIRTKHLYSDDALQRLEGDEFNKEYDRRNALSRADQLKEFGGAMIPDKMHSTVYPMKVDANKTFNPETDMHVMSEFFEKNNIPSDVQDLYTGGNYMMYETKPVVGYLKSKGYDSMRLRESTGDDYPTIAVFNPSQVRSRFAAFDPFRRHEADILAGVGVGGVLAPELISEELNKLKKKYAKGGEVAKNRAYQGEVRNTPQNKILGLAAHLLKPISEFAGKYTVPERDPIFGGMTGADLTGVESLRKVAEDASYRVPPTTGRGMTITLKPEVVDAAGGATLLGQAGKAFVKGAAKEAARQIHTGTGVLGSKVIDPRQRMFVGEKSQTWDSPAAAKAAEMESAGESPVKIWAATKNFKGPDKKWRQEIDDSVAPYSANAASLGSQAFKQKQYDEAVHASKLKEIMDTHSIGTADASKIFADKYGREPISGSVYLADRTRGHDLARNEAEALSSLQDKNFYGHTKEFYDNPRLYEAYPHLKNMLTHVEDIPHAGGVFSPSGGGSSAYITLDRRSGKPELLHEMQHAIQDKEGWARGSSPDAMFSSKGTIGPNTLNPEAQKIFDGMVKAGLKPSQDDAAREAYHRHAGEVESRLTEARMNMTPAERAANIPKYDVPVEDQIVKFKYAKGGKIASAGGDWLAKKLVQYQEQARPSKAENIAAGLYHPIGGGIKLVKPLSEMTSTRVPNTPMVPRKAISPEELYGSYIVPALGDRTAAGSLLTHIGEAKLDIPVQLEGGADFMRSHAPYGAAWAADKGAASSISKQIRGAAESGRDVYMPYVAMAHTPSGDFSTMMANSLLEQIGNSKITKKAVKEFDRNVKAVRPEFKGLLHPETRDMLNDNGALRHAFVAEMGLKQNANAGFPDLATTRAAIAEPELLDAPLHSSGFTIAKMDPAGGIITDPASPAHTSYNTQLAGKYVGGFAAQPPRSVMFPTFYNARRAAGTPEFGDPRSFQLGHPGQVANQEWLDSVMNWMEKNPKVK